VVIRIRGAPFLAISLTGVRHQRGSISNTNVQIGACPSPKRLHFQHQCANWCLSVTKEAPFPTPMCKLVPVRHQRGCISNTNVQIGACPSPKRLHFQYQCANWCLCLSVTKEAPFPTPMCKLVPVSRVAVALLCHHNLLSLKS